MIWWVVSGCWWEYYYAKRSSYRNLNEEQSSFWMRSTWPQQNLCLQSILEGKGVFLKKIGKYIKPADGFNVMQCISAKENDGRFIGTNVLNGLLERFQSPSNNLIQPSIENKILSRICDDSDFVSHLVDWVTLSVRLSTMVVSKTSSPPVVWSTSSSLLNLQR